MFKRRMKRERKVKGKLRENWNKFVVVVNWSWIDCVRFLERHEPSGNLEASYSPACLVLSAYQAVRYITHVSRNDESLDITPTTIYLVGRKRAFYLLSNRLFGPLVSVLFIMRLLVFIRHFAPCHFLSLSLSLSVFLYVCLWLSGDGVLNETSCTGVTLTGDTPW